MFITDEQRQILMEDGAPLPLIDGDQGKCYMVVPVEFSHKGLLFQARMPGVDAVAEADVPSDAATGLAILLRKITEQR